MDKENNRNAAGLRRSAVVERIKLREEWSALKGIPEPNTSHNTNRQQATKAMNKKSQSIYTVTRKTRAKPKVNTPIQVQVISDVLRGVVALVEVGAESRALALRAALGALGATVVPSWNPLVTHLIWAQGGCRSTRAKARALASRLVSPLWVEACAASNRRLPEQTFPAAARPSDLPSPRTLRRLLKKAEMENIPLVYLLSDSKEEDVKKSNPLRISSETDEHDTTGDTTRDTSHDTTCDTTVTDVESRVNTAPRRALPASVTPQPAKRSRRKLFTHKEVELHSSDEDDGEEQTAAVKRTDSRLTQRAKKELARAERMAKRMVAACSAATQPAPVTSTLPRIALTGMSRSERQAVYGAVRSLNGRLQAHVNRKTTHVLLGSCREDPDTSSDYNITNHCPDFSGVSSIKTCRTNGDVLIPRCDIKKARTLKALDGAARGCRVLYGQWALDSLEADMWLHHYGYEVAHLKKISQKARLERKALGRMRSEYAYDVFNGMRVRLSSTVEQKDAATQLLTLCGAIVIDQNGGLIQNGGLTQKSGLSQKNRLARNGALTENRLGRNGGLTQNGDLTQIGALQDGDLNYDLTLGTGNGEVSSKWVFDSVAAGRMRTTRRYVNNATGTSFESQNTNEERNIL